MTPQDKARVREIVGLWMVYQDKETALREIALAGPTIESKMMDFRGDFPQMSNVKPEILINKVHKQRKFHITDQERRANIIISAFPDEYRRILTAYEEKRKKHNRITQKPWTHKDIATVLKLELDRYKAIRMVLMKIVVGADKAQDIDSSRVAIHNMLKSTLA